MICQIILYNLKWMVRGVLHCDLTENKIGTKMQLCLNAPVQKHERPSWWPRWPEQSPRMPRLSTSGGVQARRCSPGGLPAVARGLSWGGLALLGGGARCDVVCVTICERWTVECGKCSCMWYGFKLLESGLGKAGAHKWPSYGVRSKC